MYYIKRRKQDSQSYLQSLYEFHQLILGTKASPKLLSRTSHQYSLKHNLITIEQKILPYSAFLKETHDSSNVLANLASNFKFLTSKHSNWSNQCKQPWSPQNENLLTEKILKFFLHPLFHNLTMPPAMINQGLFVCFVNHYV